MLHAFRPKEYQNAIFRSVQRNLSIFQNYQLFKKKKKKKKKKPQNTKKSV